ncbi:MAG TPA: hypothetical protein VFK94_06620 [Patescibacteria group bacterium]|nr:hypothetical protein [Patescibacteria group bacterium]
MIPMNDCHTRHLYRLYSRNLDFGVYDGAGGFIGIREKFDSRFLFTEYHREVGSPVGTVQPLEDLGPIPDWIDLNEIPGTALFEYLDGVPNRRSP